MAEAKAEKPAAPRKRAAKPMEAGGAAPKKTPAKKAAAAAKPAPGKQVRVTQIGSPIGREDYQRATLKGLGLDKMHRSRVLEDTPSVRGMIERVKHLLRIEAAE